MRNFTVYLVLLLCLFVNRITAQETFDQASAKYSAKYHQIRLEEEKTFAEGINKLKIQRREGIIFKQEFKEQKIVLEKKKIANIKERDNENIKELRKKFPELWAKSFVDRATQISIGIKSDVREEKDSLKIEIEAVDKQLMEGVITKAQAEEQKQKLANARAKAIEEKVKVRKEALNKLVQDDIDNLLPNPYENDGLSLTLFGNNISQKTKTGDIDPRTNIDFPAMKAYHGQKDKDRKENRRTSSQLVFALGVNNVITDGAVANSDFKYWQSHFYEWGLTFNSRIISNYNLLHFKYGLSLMYNNLRPTDNRVFEVNGDQTDLVVSPIDLEESRFRNVNFVAPLHLEFDFTKPKIKNDKTYFKSHNSFRLGVGGYFGFNVKSKQKLCFDDVSGRNDVRQITKGSFNVNDFIYGLSTYVSYKATGLYLKYDLNPLFKDNVVKQNNVSLGLRFDFN
ncbi:porin family protein [Flavobacterium gilvum]|uniref:hypothetical protein n=1 Tax=Flavobacterium gilvum TaxID=1492737 RepID=UPI0004E3E1D6|nr:hypothetical protein [Flavobacterium gilvum]KFC59510.1 hypothetical protein FEM08_16570 [Flavobacterium gilvum]